MFAAPKTPQSQTRSGTWPRYIGGPNAHLKSSFTHRLDDPNVFKQPPLSVDRLSNHSHSSSVASLSSPTLSQSSPLAHVESLQTPFVLRNNHTARHVHHSHSRSSPSFDSDDLHMSPIVMPPYPDTPSPPAAYGLNGTLIVNEPPVIMQSNGTPSCTPIIDQDVFLSKSASRPALRPSLSHNAAYANTDEHAGSPWSRRVMHNNNTHQSSDDMAALGIMTSNDRARPSTAGTILDATAPSVPSSFTPELRTAIPSSTPIAINHAHHHSHHGPTSQHPHPHHHEATTTINPAFATPLSSSAPTNSTPYSSHPINVSTGGPYNDDLSFHTSSYAGSYDSSFSSAGTNGSPWAAPYHMPSPQHHHQHMPPMYAPGAQHMYPMYSHKEMEPILAPGEVPAPRPPMSYAALIGEALLMAPPPHQLYVSEISDSIKKRYAYYRQNPTKIYNGVRHQTSMCKAFVKLPRPFGDQSGGARKWAIRAGCETWFSNGGYHPPGSNASPTLSNSRIKGGKAKATARAKQLAIGTGSPGEKRAQIPFDDGPWSAGPSNGPAYDGTNRHMVPYPQQPPHPTQGYPNQHQHQQHHPNQSSHLPPGYHYVPVPSAPGQSHGNQQAMYVPVWGPYPSTASPPPPPPPPVSASTQNSSSVGGQLWSRSADADSSCSPEQEHWRDESGRIHSATSPHGSQHTYEEKPSSPRSRGHSPHGTSPERR